MRASSGRFVGKFAQIARGRARHIGTRRNRRTGPSSVVDDRPFWMAYFWRAARLCRFSFAIRLSRWRSTVRSLRSSILAISLMVRPSASNRSTSCSRWARPRAVGSGPPGTELPRDS